MRRYPVFGALRRVCLSVARQIYRCEKGLPVNQRLIRISKKLGGMFSFEHGFADAFRATPGEVSPPSFDSFDRIYRQAVSGMPPSAYNILKVAAMINSPHLAGMPTEFRRGSVMMALEAAEVHVTDILQDAMLRQQALEQYEESQQKKLREFEAYKGDANRRIQAEMDRTSAECMGKIQSNIDEVARQQDAFRGWVRNKQAESNVLSSASACCTQPGSAMNGAYSAVIEHQGRR